MTPKFTIGCKRILLPSNYYPALAQPNVDVLTTGVTEVRGNTVVGGDGTEREVDAIVLGTGFHVTDLLIADHVRGAEGTTLAEAWQGLMQGYKGATVPGFPNFSSCSARNTGLGHLSMIYMVEASVQYVIDALEQMQQNAIATVDVRPERYRHWNAGIQRRMPQTVWQTGGCASWYQDEHGRNTTLWPDFTFKYRNLTQRFDIESYTTMPRREAAPAAPGEQAGEPTTV